VVSTKERGTKININFR